MEIKKIFLLAALVAGGFSVNNSFAMNEGSEEQTNNQVITAPEDQENDQEEVTEQASNDNTVLYGTVAAVATVTALVGTYFLLKHNDIDLYKKFFGPKVKVDAKVGNWEKIKNVFTLSYKKASNLYEKALEEKTTSDAADRTNNEISAGY